MFILAISLFVMLILDKYKCQGQQLLQFSDEIQKEENLRKKPIVKQQADAFGCDKANLDNSTGICAYSGSLIFQQDTVYTNNQINSLIITNNSQIGCRDPQQQACILQIQLQQPNSSIILKNGSQILAQRVVIDSPNTALYIDSSSQISASGSSYAFKGSSLNAPADQAASMVGQGGNCGGSQNQPIYARFDMMNPSDVFDINNYQVGSQGMIKPTSDRQTAGGGYIYFNIEALNISGNGNASQIESNGSPFKNTALQQDKMGGSGGYIHIITKNLFINNSVDTTSKITAHGGNGLLNGYGASGGVIILDGAFNFSNDQQIATANGGIAGSIASSLIPKGCGNGAAGTVWLKQQDTLFISNGNIITSKYTTLFAKNGQQFQNENSIAKNIIIDGGAFVNIQIYDQQQPNYNGISSILFTNLTMKKNSRMQFDLGQNTNQLTIKYTNNFDVDKDSYINFENVYRKTIFQSFQKNNINIIKLGKIDFKNEFYIEADQVYIQNNITDPSSPNTNNNDIQGLIQFVADQLYIQDNVHLRAPQIFMYGNDSVYIGSGTLISSIKQFTCSTDQNSNLDMFSCMSDDFDDSQLTQEMLIGAFNKQYTQQASSISQMANAIMAKWNIYILSAGEFTIKGSKVIAPRIGVCANNISMFYSALESSYQGCQHDSGLGNKPILKSPQCSGPGASHGGNGGAGGVQSSDGNVQNQCQNYYPNSYYFGKEARFEGSGGTSGDFNKKTGGSGGGIIWVKTPGTILMNDSRVSADGSDGQNLDPYQLGSGGGSGGSIQITTLNIMGNGMVSAQGGSGSKQGGGGGSGGRFIMNYLKPYLRESYPTQSFNWFGNFSISGGKNGDISQNFGQAQSGSNGTAFHSKCFPGYEGVFCRACDPGFFKQDYSYANCIPCQNKPYFSKYVGRAMNNSMCDYECSPLFESSKTNKDCIDPLSLQVQRIGGVIPFFVLLGIFLLFSLVVFAMLSHRSQLISDELKDLPETLYMMWEKDYSGPNFRGNTEENEFGMNDDCVWSHTHRMYLIGQNNIGYPWFIPKDFPRDALKKQDREKLIQFIDDYNPKLRYTFCEKLSFVILTFLYSPLQDFYHIQLRKRKFNKMQTELYSHFPASFWSDKGNNKSIRFSCSKNDYFMAYIDFIDFSVNKENWQGLRVPICILLAGNGTFNSPYNLDFQDDIYVKSLVLLKFDFFQDKLAIFLENFNSQLSKLSFFKLQFQIMRDINNIVEWLEKANEALFYHFNVKCILYVIENQYSEADGGVFKQKRRSFPLETIFFDAFPEMYIKLINYVRERMISRKSEIRLAMIFKRYTKSKKIKTEMRVNMMKESDQKNAYKQAVNNQESVLFDEEDRDFEDEIVRYDLKDEDRSNSQNSLDSSYSSLQSEVQLLSDPPEKKKGVKLVDKTRRAFSISIESSKAFELAIRKPRKKCKHTITRIKAVLYGLYLFLMKQQGSPPQSRNLNFLFMIYSGLLSLDIMILFNYTLHLFLPYTNFVNFGWVFMFLIFLVAYTGPTVAFVASLKGSPYLMKLSSHMNSLTIMSNIPLVLVVSFYFDEDSIYFVVLALMVIVKMGLSASSAKVRQYLINPRFSKNAEKLKKILKRQNQKLVMREEILGKETIQQIEGISVLGSQTEIMSGHDFGNQSMISSENVISKGQVINSSRLRDKLLE